MDLPASSLLVRGSRDPAPRTRPYQLYRIRDLMLSQLRTRATTTDVQPLVRASRDMVATSRRRNTGDVRDYRQYCSSCPIGRPTRSLNRDRQHSQRPLLCRRRRCTQRSETSAPGPVRSAASAGRPRGRVAHGSWASCSPAPSRDSGQRALNLTLDVAATYEGPQLQAPRTAGSSASRVGPLLPQSKHRAQRLLIHLHIDGEATPSYAAPTSHHQKNARCGNYR